MLRTIHAPLSFLLAQRPHHRVVALLTKRLTALLLLLLLLLQLALPAAAAPRRAAPAADAPPRLASAAALVVEAGAAQAALVRGGGAPRSIASITKLMTAMVVLDEGLALDAPLDVSSDDFDTVKNTRSRLRRVVTLTRGELLTAALLSSDNMAALALARHSAGGREAFVRKMNDKARELGLSVAVFVDPAGLAPDNRASPLEVAKMVTAASSYPFIRSTTTQPAALIHGLAYRNTNPLASDPAWGIQLSKTGFTNEAGRASL